MERGVSGFIDYLLTLVEKHYFILHSCPKTKVSVMESMRKKITKTTRNTAQYAF